MLIAQISDCHLVEPGVAFVDRLDTGDGLAAAIATIEALPQRPDLVLATGDLVDTGSAVEYDRLTELLAACSIPVVPIPGNHDDRSELRARFPGLPPGGAMDPIHQVIDEYPVRIVALDTMVPGAHGGTIDPDTCGWLDDVLRQQPGRPTLVAQHHPPLPSGIPWMDEPYPFVGAADEAAVLQQHPQVLALVCGHLHRSYQQRFGGTVVITCPSTACQLSLSFSGSTPMYTDEPTGLLLHRWDESVGLTTHQVPIGGYGRWAPSWA